VKTGVIVSALTGMLYFLSSAVFAAQAGRSDLTVCADPNNLPFSNRAGEGFENKIAHLIARDLNARIHYVWWAQRRGYVRNTLNEAACDLWPGVAAGVDRVATSPPYYRSTYVFVSRLDKPFAHLTLDDPRLEKAAIGVQMIGTNSENTPPAHAIAAHGLIDNVHGYMLYGDYRESNPTAAIITAVAHGDVDVALVWGPLAGYFAARSRVRMRIEAITPADDSRWPMHFDIAMGVRPGDPALLSRIDGILAHEKPHIDSILTAYHVPPATIARD
jgi:mxaJ protein